LANRDVLQASKMDIHLWRLHKWGSIGPVFGELWTLAYIPIVRLTFWQFGTWRMIKSRQIGKNTKKIGSSIDRSEKIKLNMYKMDLKTHPKLFGTLRNIFCDFFFFPRFSKPKNELLRSFSYCGSTARVPLRCIFGNKKSIFGTQSLKKNIKTA